MKNKVLISNMKNKVSIHLVLTKYKQKKRYKIIVSQYILNQSFIKMELDVL
jgi:hypothetical protein